MGDRRERASERQSEKGASENEEVLCAVGHAVEEHVDFRFIPFHAVSCARRFDRHVNLASEFGASKSNSSVIPLLSAVERTWHI